MRIFITERADREVSEANREVLAQSLYRELRKIAEDCRRIGDDCFEVKSVDTSSSSILRNDTAIVTFRANRRKTGYMIDADVSCTPSVWFWFFCLMTCWFVMALVIWLYFYNCSLVENGISRALKNAVRNVN